MVQLSALAPAKDVLDPVNWKLEYCLLGWNNIAVFCLPGAGDGSILYAAISVLLSDADVVLLVCQVDPLVIVE